MAETTLAEFQAQLIAILAPQGGPTSILVGHSLESDLMMGRPPNLCLLSSRLTIHGVTQFISSLYPIVHGVIPIN
jgi:RNA exonuclease 1